MIVAKWVRDFEGSEEFPLLGDSAKQALAGGARVVVRCLTRRWDGRMGPDRLDDMTGGDAIDVLTEQLPRTLVTVDADAIVEGLVAFLIWAGKTNRIRSRDVEYACRKSRQAAIEAMRNETKWSPGKSIVLHALRDGVDPGDLDAVRVHAIASGLDPTFVAEFLPPGPTYLGNGNWLWLELFC